MRLTQSELFLLFSEVSLTNDISGCKRILSNYLKTKGYKVYQNYRLQATGDLVDIVAVKDNHNMAIVIGRKYPRKNKINMLSKVTTADNRVFLLREGNTPYEYLQTVDCIDVNMSEPLHNRGKYNSYKRETDIYGED